jgi:hypothetical protein
MDKTKEIDTDILESSPKKDSDVDTQWLINEINDLEVINEIMDNVLEKSNQEIKQKEIELRNKRFEFIIRMGSNTLYMTSNSKRELLMNCSKCYSYITIKEGMECWWTRYKWKIICVNCVEKYDKNELYRKVKVNSDIATQRIHNLDEYFTAEHPNYFCTANEENDETGLSLILGLG